MGDKKSEKINEVPLQTVIGSQLPLVILPVNDENIEYNPFEHRKLDQPTTDAETLAHLLKGSLGSGILAMPLAFANAGLWFGLIAMFLIGIICTYCVHILVKCEHILCRRTQTPSLNYSELAECAFLVGPKSIHKYSRVARIVVNTFIVMVLVGCCCVYNVFVATNTKQVVEHYANVSFDLRWYIFALLPLLILINLIRDLKRLAIFSVVANGFVAVSLIITAYYVLTDLPSPSERPAIADYKKMPLFFGTAIFALEAIGVVMSLENNMQTPQNFIGCPGVLNIGMFVVTILYTAVGFLGYLKFGEDTMGSITLNLPLNEVPAQSVKVMIAIAIFLTYSLQFYVPMNIVWSNIRANFSEKNLTLAEYTTRFSLITFTVALAIAIPTIGPFMSLIGAICVSTLGFIFPATIEIITYYDRPGFGFLNWILCKDIFLIVFGILGFFFGTYASIVEIRETLASL